MFAFRGEPHCDEWFRILALLSFVRVWETWVGSPGMRAAPGELSVDTEGGGCEEPHRVVTTHI